MIADLALRWVVTILFGLCAVECLLALGAGSHSPLARVNHSVHLVMAVAMGAMAWPRGADIPTTGPMVFFLIASAWFAVVTVSVPGQPGARAANGYHSLMMMAMAWMYAVMNGGLLPGQAAGDPAHAHTHQGMHHAPDIASGHGEPLWISAINWAWTLWLTSAAVVWLYRYFAIRRTDGGPITLTHLGILRQTMMAAGMAIMFAVML